jgi:cadmium resistance protein CadD (predicted permease)
MIAIVFLLGTNLRRGMSKKIFRAHIHYDINLLNVVFIIFQFFLLYFTITSKQVSMRPSVHKIADSASYLHALITKTDLGLGNLIILTK